MFGKGVTTLHVDKRRRRSRGCLKQARIVTYVKNGALRELQHVGNGGLRELPRARETPAEVASPLLWHGAQTKQEMVHVREMLRKHADWGV